MEKKSNSGRVLSAKDLWKIFAQRWWIIIAAALIVIAAMFTVIKITFVPKYTSMATIYIMKEEGNMTSAEKVNEYNLAIRVIYDYDYMLKSKTVLNAVRQELNGVIDDPVLSSYASLRNAMTITNPTDTRILEISIESDSAENSKIIVDTICKIGMDKIAQAMDGEGQATLFEVGGLSKNPSNVTGFFTYLVVGVAAAILVYIVFIMVHVFDDRIKSNEEIEEYFSLSILGDIPDASESVGKRYRRYGRYGAYQIYGSARGNYAGKKDDKSEDRGDSI